MGLLLAPQTAPFRLSLHLGEMRADALRDIHVSSHVHVGGRSQCRQLNLLQGAVLSKPRNTQRGKEGVLRGIRLDADDFILGRVAGES